MIKERKAKLVENAQDILRNFDDSPLPLVFRSAWSAVIPLDKEEAELFRKMPIKRFQMRNLQYKSDGR